MGIGGGSNSSSSSSRPLTPAERYNGLAGGLSALSGFAPIVGDNGNFDNANVIVNAARNKLNDLADYKAPQYRGTSIYGTEPVVDAGNAERLSGGDYNRLENSILESRTAPLEYALKKAQAGVDSDAAKRGVWSSGLAIQSGHDLVDRFAPELRAAAADAATQRYGLEASDINAANAYKLNRATGLNTANLGRAQNLNQANQFESAQQNSFNMENANRLYNAKWAPANYIRDAYNGTGGTISSGSSSGWNTNLSI